MAPDRVQAFNRFLGTYFKYMFLKVFWICGK